MSVWSSDVCSSELRRPMHQGWLGLCDSDVMLHAGAFNWTYTLGVGLVDPWAVGATTVLYNGPRDVQVWPVLLEKHKATLFAAVPTLRSEARRVGKERVRTCRSRCAQYH